MVTGLPGSYLRSWQKNDTEAQFQILSLYGVELSAKKKPKH